MTKQFANFGRTFDLYGIEASNNRSEIDEAMLERAKENLKSFASRNTKRLGTAGIKIKQMKS